MKKEEKIRRLKEAISELEDKKLTIETAIFGLNSQIILEELRTEGEK